MPTSKQAKKRMRQSEERRIKNKAVRSTMRTAMKKVLQAETEEVARAALPEAMKCIDKAAKRNVIHENAAARYKSRLARTSAAKG